MDNIELDHDTDNELDSSNETEDSVEEKGSNTASKIGEISDFEQELIDSNVITEFETSSKIVENAKLSEPSETSEKEEGFDDYLSHDLNTCLENDIVLATITDIKKSGVLVDFSYKSDGFIPTSELIDQLEVPLEVGSTIHAMIQKLETKEGYSLLSEKDARAELIWDEFSDDMSNKKLVNVIVKKVMPRGYIVAYENQSGFLRMDQDKKLEENDVTQAIIVNIDKYRKKILFSTRNIHELMEKKEKTITFLQSINVGDIISGVVSGIKKFGVFVNFGAAEGLIHVSELSWRRIINPTDVVNLEDKIETKVLSIDLENNKLSLSVKQLTEDPWQKVAENYKVGQIVSGEIKRITKFGAFVLIDNSIEGLLHISEITRRRIEDISNILNIGEQVFVKVIKLSISNQKIGLSLKNVPQDNEGLANRLSEG